MRTFGSFSNYRLSPVQVDLIIHCLNNVDGKFDRYEDNEARKIIAELLSGGEKPEVTSFEDPYANYCDI